MRRVIPRVSQVLLAAVAIAGGVATFSARIEQQPLRREYVQLVNEVGLLDVPDPNKVYLRALPTGDPYHFAWRCYRPETDHLEYRSFHVSSSGRSSAWTQGGHSIMRVRFRFDERGITIFVKRPNGTSSSGSRDPDMGEFIKQHWGEMEITNIRDGQTTEFTPDEVIEFLSVRAPESVQDAARDKPFGAYFTRSPTIFRLEVGTPEAFEQAEAKHDSAP